MAFVIATTEQRNVDALILIDNMNRGGGSGADAGR